MHALGARIPRLASFCLPFLSFSLRACVRACLRAAFFFSRAPFRLRQGSQVPKATLPLLMNSALRQTAFAPRTRLSSTPGCRCT